MRIAALLALIGGLALAPSLALAAQPVTVTDKAGINQQTVTGAGAAKVDGSGVTQPVSAASLPLPTGAMGASGGTVGLVAGSAVIGHVIVDTAPTTAVTIASLPSGAVTNAGTFPVQSQPTGYTSTNGSTTVTTGNTFQTILASNASRHGCLIQNPADATETLYVNVKDAVGSATKARSFQVAAGQTFSCSMGGGGVITDIINVTATTTGHAFVEADQ